MRRAKLGDVYAVKVPNGYKIVQWAYDIQKYGTFIRVFDGLFDSIPKNVADIVAGPHNYLIRFFAARAYRIGLFTFLENIPVPEDYPFPDYSITFNRNQHYERYSITLLATRTAKCKERYLVFNVSSVDELPEELRNIKLVNATVSPDWLLYLFDNGYSLQNPDVFDPVYYWGKDWELLYQKYIDMVDEAQSKDPLKKKQTSNSASTNS